MSRDARRGRGWSGGEGWEEGREKGRAGGGGGRGEWGRWERGGGAGRKGGREERGGSARDRGEGRKEGEVEGREDGDGGRGEGWDLGGLMGEVGEKVAAGRVGGGEGTGRGRSGEMGRSGGLGVCERLCERGEVRVGAGSVAAGELRWGASRFEGGGGRVGVRQASGAWFCVDLNEPKDSSKTDKAAQNGRTPKSLTLEIHHGGWFTPTPSRSYIGGHVSSVNVVDIDEFCLHDLKDMVVKLGYGVEDLMYCHFLIPSLGLDYGLHSLNVDADVLEMSKYVKDYKIILVYVEHGSSNVDTSMFDSSPDVNRNVKKEWEKVSSKSSSIGEVMKKLSKEQPASSVARPIVVESVVDPFDGLDEILGDYANTGKQITRDESTWKQMLVHVGTSSTADDFSFGKFKEVEVEADTESEEEESDTEGNDTSGSDSEDLDYDPKHDDVFDDDEHIVEEVHVNMNNFSFTADPKHDTSIGVVDV
ncbi:hypothetical protein Tco_1491035, partial [Tanacetum coccineum]